MSNPQPDLLTRAMHVLPPEVAHWLALRGLRHLTAMVPRCKLGADHSSGETHMGMQFPHPICLAAGFDKNAEATHALAKFGFAAVEIGSVTLNPQPGNPRPRMFRLLGQAGLINRMGFNSGGMERVQKNLSTRPEHIVLGVNLGLNKGVSDYERHFRLLVAGLAHWADYFTINLSSPNTPGLRSLLNPSHLALILSSVWKGMEEADTVRPVVLKLSPDMEVGQEKELISYLAQAPIQGIIVSNTTVDRSMLSENSRHRHEVGGLSGPPLAARAIRLLKIVKSHIPENVTIIASGGVSSGQDVFERLRAGAHLVQLYTAFAYRGWRTVPRLLEELHLQMKASGVASYSEIRHLQ